MMNKKKRTTYLLLAVVGIYAAIAVRFFLLKGGDSTPEISLTQVGDFKPIRYAAAKEFTITNDYRDPFLGTRSKAPSTTIPSSSSKPKTSDAKPFPAIQYMGIIADSGSSSKILSIRIAGTEYVVRIGDEIEGVRILSGNEKEIKVRFEGEQKTITM